MGATAKPAGPDSVTAVEAWFAALADGDRRSVLATLRARIKSAAPAAEECMYYGMPAFKLHGPLVAYAANKRDCSLHLMSKTCLDAHRAELAGFSTSAAEAVHFTADKPLPAALVRKLVKARIAENRARAGDRPR